MNMPDGYMRWKAMVMEETDALDHHYALNLFKEMAEVLEWYESKDRARVSKTAWSSSDSRSKWIMSKIVGWK